MASNLDGETLLAQLDINLVLKRVSAVLRLSTVLRSSTFWIYIVSGCIGMI
jgi:hypothetical protein